MLGMHVASVLRKAFLHESGLSQVGKNPRYFDMSKSRCIGTGKEGEKLLLYPGFKATPWLYGNDLYLNVDSVTKFIPQTSAMRQISALREKWQRDNRNLLGSMSSEETDAAFKEHFLDNHESESIVTQYGNKKPYRICDFLPRGDLRKITFQRTVEGEQVTTNVFEYFKEFYSVTLTNPI